MRISDWSSDVCSSDLVRKGSIIADLIPSIPDLIGYMDNVLIVGGFGALFSARVRKLISGQFIDTSNKGDVAEVGKTLRAISKDNTGDMTVESVELEQGLWKRRTLLKFGASEARSEEHTSELQSLMRISYAVFCLKKK